MQGDDHQEQNDDELRGGRGIPGSFISSELEDATARFLAEVRRIVRRRFDEDDSEDLAP
jgi:ABC-type sulfate transport system substrate-binding protein